MPATLRVHQPVPLLTGATWLFAEQLGQKVQRQQQPEDMKTQDHEDTRHVR